MVLRGSAPFFRRMGLVGLMGLMGASGMALGMVFQRCRCREVRRADLKPNVHDFVTKVTMFNFFFCGLGGV